MRLSIAHVALLASLSIGAGDFAFAASARGAASSSGAWTKTGSLRTARVAPMGATLPDGTVLVAGGLDNNNHAMASAELFDPQTGRWSRTRNMTLARVQSTMTVLLSGKVLVAGGEGPSGLTATTELFDPTTHRWSQTGAMGTARANHTATLLADGRVLVAGGLSQNGSGGIASSELYDPATGKWSATGSMSTSRESHAATLLANGQVLVSGGNLDFLDGALGSAEIFDPNSGKWSTVGRMMTSRSSHISMTLADGSVIVAGGDYGNMQGFNPLSMTDRFDPATGLWSPVGDMQIARGATPHLAGRAFQTATLLADGRVLVAGGFGYTTDFTQTVILNTAELYDPQSATWTLTGNMHQARAQHVAVMLQDGRTLVAGGYDFGPPLAGAEIFTPSARASGVPQANLFRRSSPRSQAIRSLYRIRRPAGILGALRVASGRNTIGTWTLTGSMHVGRAFAPATLLPNGKVLVEGCDAFGSGGTTAELYDPARGKWSFTGSMHVPRCLHSALLLPDGRVLVAGGANGANVLSSMEVYNPRTGRWSHAGTMNSTRADGALALLANGSVLAPAGFAVNGVARDSADLYSPANRASVATPSLQLSRSEYTAQLLPNGKVLVAGGFTQNSANTSTSELYDPAVSVWTYTGSMVGEAFVSVLLNSGQVLATTPSQLYDPTAGMWALTHGGLNIDRINNTLTVLTDGRVLAAGGCTTVSTCELVTQSEVYDPKTQLWTRDAVMNVARESQSAVRLPDGRVLVAGGFGQGFQQLTSAEIYAEGTRH